MIAKVRLVAGQVALRSTGAPLTDAATTIYQPRPTGTTGAVRDDEPPLA
jgi:hypothetical protein